MRKSRKKSLKVFIFGLVTGMAAMFFLDMVFHFNNSVETKLKREIDKTLEKLENIIR
jgi:hypothetical protein